ncbi:pyridoxamine 5'-phosphate oxidase family protein [Amycolatopsis acidicola]|uniref:Pyridoxamine 5'-phosphate oxidase family protein n=1 Tax=Amycolatopsis acidicola TaxID=2596893 RepID=A0A5N0ULN9_9PSEU|nr:pyridoxamine 5'-phosphate oxidase family protein [Amycolatopsis acidicola]KAA9150111.1 pyridoxamine 5'-phosphate oxidase family protein [Amycolatopsis acidicola]
MDLSGLENVDPEECFRLLAQVDVGRVVFTIRGLPAVQPVRYALWEEAVWFLARADSDLFGAAQDGVVAFEIDHFDAGLRTGWWVTVLGRAAAVPGRDLPRRLPGLSWQLPLPADVRCVRIPVEVVSGRKVAR